MDAEKLGPCPLCGGEPVQWPATTMCSCHNQKCGLADITIATSEWNRLSTLAAQNKRRGEALERIANTCEAFDGCPVGPATIAELAREALK